MCLYQNGDYYCCTLESQDEFTGNWTIKWDDGGSKDRHNHPPSHLKDLKEVSAVFIGNLFILDVGGPFLRASGEKCFLNPKGFRKFFECFPNHYAKDFVGGGRNSTTEIYSKFDPFFYLLKYAVKCHILFFQ